MCPKQETTIFNIPLLEWHYYIITQPWTVYYVIISKKTISSILLDIWYQDIHCASACVYIFFTPSSHHTNLLKHLTLFSTLLGILHTFTIVTSIATVERKNDKSSSWMSKHFNFITQLQIVCLYLYVFKSPPTIMESHCTNSVVQIKDF